MKLEFELCLWFLTADLLTRAAKGLPFTRSQKKSDEEEAVVEQSGEVIKINRHKGRRNVVLDNFSAGGDENEATSTALLKEIRLLANNQTDFLVATRRTLHRRPELMYRESETSALVQKILTELEIPYSNGWALNANPNIVPGSGGYGIVADIGTGGEPCVLLRADMDALPITERTEGIDEFKSENNGRMHACGHDGHTSKYHSNCQGRINL